MCEPRHTVLQTTVSPIVSTRTAAEGRTAPAKALRAPDIASRRKRAEAAQAEGKCGVHMRLIRPPLLFIPLQKRLVSTVQVLYSVTSEDQRTQRGRKEKWSEKANHRRQQSALEEDPTKIQLDSSSSKQNPNWKLIGFCNFCRCTLSAVLTVADHFPNNIFHCVTPAPPSLPSSLHHSPPSLSKGTCKRPPSPICHFYSHCYEDEWQRQRSKRRGRKTERFPKPMSAISAADPAAFVARCASPAVAKRTSPMRRVRPEQRLQRGERGRDRGTAREREEKMSCATRTSAHSTPLRLSLSLFFFFARALFHPGMPFLHPGIGARRMRRR